MSSARQGPSRLQVILYAPNLVCYLRLVLVATALTACREAPYTAYALLLVSFILDGVDGILARRLDQASAFGAFLDVAVDCVSRGLLYAAAIAGPLSALPLCLELLTFVCTHKGGGAAWKGDGYFAGAPGWVVAVMSHGFRTPLGCLTIAGLMGCPLYFWALRFLPGSVLASAPVGCVVVVGRALAAAVEVWVIARHLRGLLAEDPA